MNVYELRSGNYVQTSSGKIPFKVGFGYLSDLESYPNNDIVGVPLTPEILEKAGFKKDGFHSYVKKVENNLQTTDGFLVFSGDYLFLRHYNNENRSDDSIVTIWNKDLMNFFYVHQLQNLYSALTGEELMIEL